eukprot:scaffold102791_cov21-Cyclotella_meneghiniana.AAC.1
MPPNPTAMRGPPPPNGTVSTVYQQQRNNRRPSPIQTKDEASPVNSSRWNAAADSTDNAAIAGSEGRKREREDGKELNSPVMKPSASEDKENDENHVKSRTPRSMEHAVDNIIAA